MPLEELEQRIVVLEKEFAALKQKLLPKSYKQALDASIGLIAADPEFDEVLRLGCEYREHENRRCQCE